MLKRTERFTETMKKPLLALLTAGTMSCGGSYPIIYNPAELRPNEIEFLEYAYENLAYKYEYGVEMACRRWVYAGFEKGQLRSVLEVEHCLESEKTQGRYSWERHEDINADGLVDKLCMNRGQSYVGSKSEEEKFPKCETNSAYTIDREISLVFMDALDRARNP